MAIMSIRRCFDVLRLVSVVALTLTVLPIPEGFAQDQGESPSEDADTVTPLDVYQRRLNAAPASIREKVERLQKQAAEENWGFDPGYTSVLERSISEITGARPGFPPEAALAQQRLAGEALRLYGNALTQQKIPPLSQPLERKSCVSAREFNWAKKKKVSAVRDQGSCGSCWAFAAIGVAESSYLIENARTIDASEQLLLNCTAESSCAGGYVEHAYGQLMANGTVLEKEKQYVGEERACKPPSGPIQLVTWAPAGADWTEIFNLCLND